MPFGSPENYLAATTQRHGSRSKPFIAQTVVCTSSASSCTDSADETDELCDSLSNLQWLTSMGCGAPVCSTQNDTNAAPEPDLLTFPKADGARQPTPDDAAALDIDWQVETRWKPPFSYGTLIYMAMEESDKDKLTLHDIYCFIETNFAYYRLTPDAGWKNSIRHNLSQDPAFRKVSRHSTREPFDKAKNKGGYWEMNPAHDSSHLATKRRRKYKNRSGAPLNGRPKPSSKADKVGSRKSAGAASVARGQAAGKPRACSPKAKRRAAAAKRASAAQSRRGHRSRSLEAVQENVLPPTSTSSLEDHIDIESGLFSPFSDETVVSSSLSALTSSMLESSSGPSNSDSITALLVEAPVSIVDPMDDTDEEVFDLVLTGIKCPLHRVESPEDEMQQQLDLSACFDTTVGIPRRHSRMRSPACGDVNAPLLRNVGDPATLSFPVAQPSTENLMLLSPSPECEDVLRSCAVGDPRSI